MLEREESSRPSKTCTVDVECKLTQRAKTQDEQHDGEAKRDINIPFCLPNIPFCLPIMRYFIHELTWKVLVRHYH